MKTPLGWIRGWILSKLPGPTCYFCTAHKEGDPLFRYRHALVCHRCLSEPMTFYALELEYWEDHPKAIPPCKNCRQVTPPMWLENLPFSMHTDWYFCGVCATDEDAILRWKRISRKLMERHMAEYRLERKNLEQSMRTSEPGLRTPCVLLSLSTRDGVASLVGTWRNRLKG